MDTQTPEAASERQLAYLELVISERFDEVPSRDKLPSSKLAAGAMIDQVRSKYPALPATEAQVEELNQLAGRVGITITANDDRAGVNRQLFELRKRANSQAWNTAKAEADEALSELFPA